MIWWKELNIDFVCFDVMLYKNKIFLVVRMKI